MGQRLDAKAKIKTVKLLEEGHEGLKMARIND